MAISRLRAFHISSKTLPLSLSLSISPSRFIYLFIFSQRLFFFKIYYYICYGIIVFLVFPPGGGLGAWAGPVVGSTASGSTLASTHSPQLALCQPIQIFSKCFFSQNLFFKNVFTYMYKISTKNLSPIIFRKFHTCVLFYYYSIAKYTIRIHVCYYQRFDFQQCAIEKIE